MQAELSEQKGRITFFTIWIGQLISQLGSGLTSFAFSIWAYEITNSATILSMIVFFKYLPAILLSPIAGVVVDRLDRKHIMMFTSGASCVLILIMAALFFTGSIEIWHLFLFVLLSGCMDAFQVLAYQTSVPLLLPKKQFGRASGMISLAEVMPYVLAPVLASVLLGPIGISGVLLIDLLTFMVALGTLLSVTIPRIAKAEGGKTEKKFSKELSFGFRYIRQRKGFIGLLILFSVANFLTGVTTIGTAMVLARTGNEESLLAQVNSLSALGGIAGALIASIWGGPRRKIHGVIGAAILSGILGRCLVGVGDTMLMWAAGFFIVNIFTLIGNTNNTAIWQSKVAPEHQGRVFSVRRLYASISFPLGLVIGGYLSDHVFEPAFISGGSMADTFSWLVGTGPGAGMGLMFVIAGIVGAVIGGLGYLFPSIRNIEDESPEIEVFNATSVRQNV